MNESTLVQQEIKHPYADYKLSNAVALAKQLDSSAFDAPTASLVDARDVIAHVVAQIQHQWITGYCALDVLDAAIDGRDLTTNCRLIG